MKYIPKYLLFILASISILSAIEPEGAVDSLAPESLVQPLDSVDMSEGDSAPEKPDSVRLWNRSVEALSVDVLVDSLENRDTTVESIPVNRDSLRRLVETEAASEPGKLAGFVLSSLDKEPVEGASIRLESDARSFSAETDAYGMFSFASVPSGTYRLRAYKKGFSPLVDERFETGHRSNVEEILLEPNILKGDLIEVKAPPSAGSEAAILARRKQTSGVMEGVGAEQISKSTDSDAGAIAKRVTGTSVIGGKYIFVRGLGERYTNMTLNGLPVPSPEKDKRVVPQDLFPASALESFAIYKTFSPELPADFAGGSVALETKGIPEKNFFTVSLGTTVEEELGDGQLTRVGQERYTYDGGRYDYFGFDDGSRDIPAGVPRTVNFTSVGSDSGIVEIAKRFDNNWGLDTGEVYLDQSFSINFGRVFNLGNEARSGLLGYVGFSNDFDQFESIRTLVQRDNLQDSVYQTYNIGGKDTLIGVPKLLWHDVSPTERAYIFRVDSVRHQDIGNGEYNTRLSGMLNWGFESYNHRLWVKTLFANLSSDVSQYNLSSQREGYSTGMDNDVEDRFQLEFERRSLMVGQVGGGHYVGVSVLDSLSWAAGYAQTDGSVPDSRKYYFARNQLSDTVIQYKTKSPFGTRQWDDIQEQGIAARIDGKLNIPPSISKRAVFLEKGKLFSDVNLPTANIGGMMDLKSREFAITRYGYADLFQPPPTDTNMNFSFVESLYETNVIDSLVSLRPNGFKTVPNAHDNYESWDGSLSSYGNLVWKFSMLSMPLEMLLGLRHEYYMLNFTSKFTGDELFQNPELYGDSAVVIRQREHTVYPALGWNIEPYPNTKLRFLYSRTLVRPVLRERLPTAFYDFDEGVSVLGNPELRDTRIQNFDFRFDWFLPFNQIASFSLFHKEFTDPVERVLDANLAPPVRRFQNAQGAFVTGLEVEADLKIGELLNAVGFGNAFTRGWGLYANAAWITSEVDIDTASEGANTLTSINRPLMGQSPYLYNIKVSNEQQFGNFEMLNGLAYNIAGRRIRDVGVNTVGDLYEEPFPSLDFLGKYELGRHAVSVKVTNLLNSMRRHSIDETNNGKVYQNPGYFEAGSFVPITQARVNELFAAAPQTYKVREDNPGIGLSLGYSVGF